MSGGSQTEHEKAGGGNPIRRRRLLWVKTEELRVSTTSPLKAPIGTFERTLIFVVQGQQWTLRPPKRRGFRGTFTSQLR
jgi:hypothetical protein